MGFMGEQRKVTKGIDLFHIPRITFYGTASLNDYIRAIS